MAAEKLYFPSGLAQTQAESARFHPLFFIVSSLSSGILFPQSSPSFKKKVRHEEMLFETDFMTSGIDRFIIILGLGFIEEWFASPATAKITYCL